MLVLIAGYDPAAFDVPFHLWYPLESVMLHAISHDSNKRDAPDERVLVLHARPAYSAEVLAGSARDWQAELLWELGELMGARAARPRWCEGHVWREAYVRASDSLRQPVVFESPRGGRLALVGEAFASDAGLEGAYMSGLSVAEQIGTLPAVRDEVRRRAGERRETADA
jgi:predicted NAD/FAD-dependent oxidoreductase